MLRLTEAALSHFSLNKLKKQQLSLILMALLLLEGMIQTQMPAFLLKILGTILLNMEFYLLF